MFIFWVGDKRKGVLKGRFEPPACVRKGIGTAGLRGPQASISLSWHCARAVIDQRG